MDIKAHEQALQNIRNKYAQNPIAPIKVSTPVQLTQALSNPSSDLFRTPTKIPKKEQITSITTNATKPKPQVKPRSEPQSVLPQPAEPSSLGREGIHAILSKKLVFAKDKGRGRDFDQIITERDKQLTERVQRNRQLLSKSKEVRQRQSQNGSVDKASSPTRGNSKKPKESEVDLNQLKLILKDKNYVINDKTTHQKKVNGIGVHATNNNENVYNSIKMSFTQKMNQNLAENVGGSREPKVPRMNYDKERRKQVDDKSETSSKNTMGSETRREKSLIKTPIPPPKQSSPSKIASIFSNTQKIEQRIHALLSR